MRFTISPGGGRIAFFLRSKQKTTSTLGRKQELASVGGTNTHCKAKNKPLGNNMEKGKSAVGWNTFICQHPAGLLALKDQISPKFNSNVPNSFQMGGKSTFPLASLPLSPSHFSPTSHDCAPLAHPRVSSPRPAVGGETPNDFN